MAKTDFDAVAYVKNMLEKNRLFIEHEFSFTTAPSIGDMADMVYESREAANHFVLIDTSTSNTALQRNGGFYERKQYTFFMLMRFEPGNEQERIEKLGICRELKRQVLSRMLADSNRYEEEELLFFDTQNVLSQELQNFMLNGLTGLWIIFQLDQPADLRLDSNEWLD